MDSKKNIVNKDPVQESKIFELREQNNKTIRSKNGDYQVPLDKSIHMKENDILSLKSAFVDTVSSSSENVIIVEPDVKGGDVTTITISYGLWCRDWGSTFEFNENSVDETQRTVLLKSKSYIPDIETDKPNSEIYIMADESTAPGDEYNLISMNILINMAPGQTGLPIKIFDVSINTPYLNDVSFHLDFSAHQNEEQKYTQSFDQDGKLKIILLISQELLDSPACTHTEFSFPLKTQLNKSKLCKVSDIGKIYPDFSATFTQLPGSDDTSVADPTFKVEELEPVDKIFTPKIFKTQFTIPSNIQGYDAGNLCELISKNMTSITSGGALVPTAVKPINNKMFQSTKGIKDDLGFNPLWIHHKTGNTAFQWRVTSENPIGDPTANYNVGSSQFNLQYDYESEKCSIPIMHLSIYDKGGTCVKSIRSQDLQTLSYSNSHSGIFLRDMEPKSIFRDSMKFDFKSLIPPITTITKTFIGPLTDVTSFNINNGRGLVEGECITGDILGCDALVFKVQSPEKPNDLANVAAFKSFDICFDVATNDLTTTITEQISISSAQPLFEKVQESDSEGYFQIEINGINSNEFVGKDKLNSKISAIVSRYYSGQNFTSSYGEGSIQYIHKSPVPLNISNLKVRILNPDGSLAVVGDRNSVFLELITSK